jgi:hypothetical protein
MSSPATDPFFHGNPHDYDGYVPSTPKVWAVGIGVGYGTGIEGRVATVLGTPTAPVQTNSGPGTDPFYYGDPHDHDGYTGSTLKLFGVGLAFGLGYELAEPAGVVDDGSSEPIYDTDDVIIFDTDDNPI